MVNNSVNKLQTNVKISLLHFRSKTHLICNDLKGFSKKGGTGGTIGTIIFILLFLAITIKPNKLQRLEQ
jgi:hypothetical protein|nr:MAG TPA: hypothetical protein [Caudoviricetes sp.]